MEGEAKEAFEAQAHIYRHILNYATSMSLNCALQLRIPDVVHSHQKPITIQQLVSKLQLPVDKTLHLQRLMRLLTHSNFFSVTKVLDNIDQEDGNQETEGYVLTASSKLLLSEKYSPNQPNLLPFANMILDPVFVTPWQYLGKWFHGSESTVFETAHGMTMWDFANKNSGFNRLFNDAMTSDSKMLSLVVEEYHEVFDGVKSLVDVGGGTGLTAKILVEAFPHMTCTVFDLPHVVADMVDTRNLKYVGGDMFNYIPYGDVIFFKNVLHDGSDDNVLKIFKRCRNVIRNAGDKGKVIIIDIVVDKNHDKMLLDMLMMVVVEGRERSKVEWEKLFLEAGFSRYKIISNFGLRSLLEVFSLDHIFTCQNMVILNE